MTPARFCTCLLLCLAVAAAPAAVDPAAEENAMMTPERMLAVIAEVGDDLQAEGNVAEFSFQGVPLVLVFDVKADRMRLVSPIIEVQHLADGQLEAAMEANFHQALDARYAISNEVVWAAFIHPLSDLSPDLLTSAVRQVAIARATFGREYTSGALVFGGGGAGE